MAEKISGVYCILNTITGERYIGSSTDIKTRWTSHKMKSTHKRCSNNRMYQDMDKYGLDNFYFSIIYITEPKNIKKMEQKIIETIKPEYNTNNAFGIDKEKVKENNYRKNHSEKGKSRSKRNTEKRKANGYWKNYASTEKGKEVAKRARENYKKHKCIYNGEELSLNALSKRFRKLGIEKPTAEARKYLVS